MRLAFFGGSFDPPHLGHLRIARAAAQRLALDQVLLAPTGRQPLKSHDPAPFADRLAMVELLIQGAPRLAASPADTPQPNKAPNYTVDTLARLRPTLPPRAQLFFLAGADSFLTLHHWRSAELLLQPGALLDGWILAARPGFPLDHMQGALLPGYTFGPAAEAPGPVLTYSVHDGSGRPGIPIHILPDLDDPSAATAIRAALAEGREPPELPPAIAGYIRDHRLYTVLR